MGWNKMVDTKNIQSVSDYLQKHKEEIIKTYKAQGVGVGKMAPGDEDFVLVVYLQAPQQVPTNPVMLDNVRLKFEVTGKFTLHTT